jgi:hypothetical protein
METTHTPQRALIKLLSIVGLFIILVVIVWAVVQGIRAFPSVFSSLASIAESINGYRPHDDLSVTLGKNIVNSGETFTINWNDMGKGSYTFTYSCDEDSFFFIKTSEGELKEIDCDETLTLPSDVHGIFVSVESAEQRFSDVAFTLAFIPENGEPVHTENHVTVVNATVPDHLAVTPEATTTPSTPTPTPTTKPTPGVVVAPNPKPTPKPAAPAALPTLGYTDLQITYLGAGRVVGGSFVPSTTFDEDSAVAFSFQVKNIGTRTSEDWTYDLELPEDETYHSDLQAPLRPSEYAIFTVGFNLSEDTDDTAHLSGSVTTGRDTVTSNNTFSTRVEVTD